MVIAIFLCVLVFIIGNLRLGTFSLDMLHVSISLAVSVIPEVKLDIVPFIPICETGWNVA